MQTQRELLGLAQKCGEQTFRTRPKGSEDRTSQNPVRVRPCGWTRPRRTGLTRAPRHSMERNRAHRPHRHRASACLRDSNGAEARPSPHKRAPARRRPGRQPTQRATKRGDVTTNGAPNSTGQNSRPGQARPYHRFMSTSGVLGVTLCVVVYLEITAFSSQDPQWSHLRPHHWINP